MVYKINTKQNLIKLHSRINIYNHQWLYRTNIKQLTETIMKKYLFVILLLIVVLAGTSIATNQNFSIQSSNIYLDNDGTGGDGLLENPYGPLSEINWTTITNYINKGLAVNIYLKRDAEWTEEFNVSAVGPAGKPITMKSYGIGTESVINASMVVIVNPSVQSSEQTLETKNFYLDNIGTSGDGLTADTPSSDIPWTEIAELVNIGHPVNININCGTVWDELKIGVIGDKPITIKSYGTGEEPIINGMSFELI